jgi:hypothetical protein
MSGISQKKELISWKSLSSLLDKNTKGIEVKQTKLQTKGFNITQKTTDINYHPTMPKKAIYQNNRLVRYEPLHINQGEANKYVWEPEWKPVEVLDLTNETQKNPLQTHYTVKKSTNKKNKRGKDEV